MTVATKITQTITALKLKAQGLRLVSCHLWELEDLASEGWNISLKLDDGSITCTDDLRGSHWIVDGDDRYRQWKVGNRNWYISDMTWVTDIALVEKSMVGA